MARLRNNLPLILLIIFASNSKILRADDWIPDGVTVFPIDSEGYGPSGHLRICEESGMSVSLEDCTIYYECGTCDSDSGWCYKEEYCPSNEVFENVFKKCVVRPICPQELLELPSGWICEEHEERRVNPEACDQYYLCLECGKSDSGWCYWLAPCLPGQIFDETAGKCVDGECGVEPEPPTLPLSSTTSPPQVDCPSVPAWHCAWYHKCKPKEGIDRCKCELKFCGFGKHWNRELQTCRPGRSSYPDCKYIFG